MFWGSMSFLFEVMIYVGLGLPLVNVLLGQLGGSSDAAPDMDADLGGDFSGDLGGDFSGDLGGDFDADFGGDFSADIGGDLGGLGAELGDLGAEMGDLGGEMGELETQLGDLETAAVQHGMPLRFNVYCLCLSFVVMGAMGVFAMETREGMARILTLLFGLGLSLSAYALLYRFVIRPLKTNDANALRPKDLQYRHARVSFRILPDSPGRIETTDAVGASISYRAEMDQDICKALRIDEGEEVIITEVFPKEGLCYVTLPQRTILNKS